MLYLKSLVFFLLLFLNIILCFLVIISLVLGKNFLVKSMYFRVLFVFKVFVLMGNIGFLMKKLIGVVCGESEVNVLSILIWSF